MNTSTTKTPTPEPPADAGPNCAESTGSAPFNRERFGEIAWNAYREAHNRMVDAYQEPEWSGLDHERQVAFRDAAEAVVKSWEADMDAEAMRLARLC